jgi:CBS domain containing-hemolysin-like protein
MIGILFMFVVLLALSALFSSAETAITTMDELKLNNLIEEEGDPKGLYQLVRNRRSRFITTLLLGNNFINIGTAALATSLFIDLFGPELGGLIATAPTTILVLLFGEIMPKSFAVSRPIQVFQWTVAPIYWLSVVLHPFVMLFENLVQRLFRLMQLAPMSSEASLRDLEMLIEMLGQRGLLDWQKRRLLRGTLSLDRLTARDVAKPRVRMETISHEKTLGDVVELCLATGYSRIPVQEDSKDEIVGIIHLKQALHQLRKEGDRPLGEVMNPPIFVPDTKRIGPLMKDMLRSRQHLVIVVDEFGGTTGLLTLEDLLEELVGDIYDESDLSPLLRQRGNRL